jgi:hypothetical protein
MMLWMTLEHMKLKATNGWSDTSVSDLLELLTKVLSKSNYLPSSTYQAKNIICPLTLGIEKIHACLNHSILYQKEHEFKDRCPRWNASRYKQNGNSEEVEDDSNKKSKKRRGRKRKNVTPDHDIEGFKERKVPALVMWYLPVIDRLKHMFSNPRDAGLLLWHMNHKIDGKIRHSVDGRQWKQFDLAHQWTALMIQEILGLDLARME